MALLRGAAKGAAACASLLLLLLVEEMAGLVALRALAGDTLGGESAEGQDDDYRGEGEGARFKVCELGPLKPSKDG